MYGIAPPFRPGVQRISPDGITGLRPPRSARPDDRARPGAWRGRPHDNATVQAVRRHVEMTNWTYGEIAAVTGVGRASICRWTQDGRWARPPGAPVATDKAGSERASARLRARSLHRRAQDIAERWLEELERDGEVDPTVLNTALEMLKTAKLARMPKRRRPACTVDGTR